jgi:hypothetical protein
MNKTGTWRNHPQPRPRWGAELSGSGATVSSVVRPVFYARLPATGRDLGVAPAVASWDAAGSRGHARSAAFIDDFCTAVSEQVVSTAGPQVFRLDVGLPDTAALDTLHDLDNYLFPLVPKLAHRTGREFASVWASKRHAPTSQVAVGAPVTTDDPRGTYAFEVTTTASASTSLYKEQIRDQLATASPLPGRGVAMQLAFVVGPHRAWPNLWKPTIDALGAILGHDHGAGEWNARDGRITDLGLHCVVDPAIGNEIRIAIRASPARVR